MKKSILIIALFYASMLQAQNWSNYNFKPEKFPFSASFPTEPKKTVKESANDTLLTVMSSENGITYTIIASKVKSTEIANKTSSQALYKLIEKAKSSEAKSNGTVSGEPAQIAKYITQKDVYVVCYSFYKNRTVFKAMIMKMNGYAGEKEVLSFISKINLSNTNISTNTTVSLPTNTSVSNTSTNSNTSNNNTSNTSVVTNTYVVNDRVEVFDDKKNKWYGGIVIKLNTNGTYRVSYDGYSENYDEDVTADRMRGMTSATTPANVPYLKLTKGQTLTINGNLSKGSIMEDLEWAETSSMACWPGIRNVEFEGNHVGYWFDLPKKSIVKITVTPKNKNTRINIYGYSGFDLQMIPPNVTRCTTCEASHPTWIGEPDLTTPAEPQTIEFNATTLRNTVYFAVAGARGITSGDYTISIELK